LLGTFPAEVVRRGGIDMKIDQLNAHNIHGLHIDLPFDTSIGLSGWSGSGKSSFCRAVSDEATKRLVTILPKSKFMFLYPDMVKTNFGALHCSDLPCVEFLDNRPALTNARSTVGTHSTLYKEVRSQFARATRLPSELFSFNTPLGWCPACKGRGGLRGETCGDCQGSRYARSVTGHRLDVRGRSLSIVEANALSLEDLLDVSGPLGLSEVGVRIARNAVELGIGHLGLDRTLSTLSGGELTRLLLAERVGLSARMLYILDEPGLGLDEASLARLLERLGTLGERNQLWVVDHSRRVMAATQRHLYFGPGSGSDGGRLVSEAPTVPAVVPPRASKPGPPLVFKDLRCRTVDLAKLALPTRAIVAITGESGSGKTTLVRDLLVPQLHSMLGPSGYVFVGQGRSKAITSLSTVGTFLDLTSFWRSVVGTRREPCHFCHGTGRTDDARDCDWCMASGMDPDFYQSVAWNGFKVRDLLEQPISESIGAYPKGGREQQVLEFLTRLGAGYLSLSRKVRTLSTGEFQRLHLCREFASEREGKAGSVFVLDEPSRGLSQNFLNGFASALRELVENSGASVWIIEHNPFLLECADFVIDFGERRGKVDHLEVLGQAAWNRVRRPAPPIRPGALRSAMEATIGFVDAGPSEASRYMAFEEARRAFESGLLRTLSPTARWIYGGQENPSKSATVAIDFEEDVLYSEDSYLFEVLDLVGHLLLLSGRSHSELAWFDYLDREMLCRCCKGSGQVQSFDHEVVVANRAKGLWQGLLQKDVMEAIRGWNFSKIKFLFAKIKSTTDMDLSRPHELMSGEERHALWHGLWGRSFHWPEKNAFYTWRGLDHLIQKYMRSSASPLKAAIKESKRTVECPICAGALLLHTQPLSVQGRDIREVLRMSVHEACATYPEVDLLAAIAAAVPAGARLNDRVGTWPRPQQVRLKLFELVRKGFLGYRFVFRNLRPYLPPSSALLGSLARSNCVQLCDAEDATATKEELLGRHPAVKGTTFVWEWLGFKGVDKALNRLQKASRCRYCQGAGRFEIEAPEGDIEKAYVICDGCMGDGLDPGVLKEEISGAPARVWLEGRVGDLPAAIRSNAWETLEDVRLASRLQQLPKYQLTALLARTSPSNAAERAPKLATGSLRARSQSERAKRRSPT
jgi:excinuclease UvrABC ATPase subunit